MNYQDVLSLKVLFITFLGMFCLTTQAQDIRSYDGTANNLSNPTWGSSGENLIRHTSVAFKDGVSEPAGEERPNPRQISNSLFSQTGLVDDPLSLSNFIWTWGQFIDHDVDLTTDHQSEFTMISIPEGDPVFDPESTGIMVIPMKRSIYDVNTGTDIDNPRQHPNQITAFIDASNVYGSDQHRADWLRTFSQGKLKTSSGNLLPFNTITGEFGDEIDSEAPEMDDAVGVSPYLFVAGDIRANENVLLSSFHTLFVREHNRLCNELFIENPALTDEELYQKARKKVNGFIQNIVYSEWLPSMGVRLGEYAGYDQTVNPGIMNIFSGAAFRMGHSLLTSHIPRLDNNGNSIEEGDILLRDAFFNPVRLKDEGGIDPLFKGMAQQTQQNFDCQMIDDVRNFLFGAPGSGGLDLAAININRGRERGFADYNTIRTDFGLPAVSDWSEINPNGTIAADMENVFVDINKIDPWVGMLAEEHLPNSLFGQTVNKIMELQFTNLRDGDRFYFENDPVLTDNEKDIIRNTKMVDIILRNTNINLMQGNLFTSMSHDVLVSCGAIIPNANISGRFTTTNGSVLKGVDMIFTNSVNGVVENIVSEDGNYNFQSIPTCYGYEIDPSKEDLHTNGVTTYDIVLIQNHILGISELNNPYKWIAADVNNNGTITTADIISIRQLILGIIDEFPLVDAWKFIPTNHAFSDLTDPLAESLPSTVYIPNLINNGIHDFTAVKTGDVSGNANTDFDSGSQGRNLADAFIFAVDEQIITKGEEIIVDFTASEINSMQAYQFTFDFDVEFLEFQKIIPGQLKLSSVNNFAVFEKEGMITTSWNGESNVSSNAILFSLVFRGTKNASLSEAINVSSRKTIKEAFKLNGEIMDVDLMINGKLGQSLLSSKLSLYQNYPNPFSIDTKIAFNLPVDEDVLIVVSNSKGIELLTMKKSAHRGYNEVVINSKDLGSSGVFTYEIITGNKKLSKQMIFID